MQAEGLSRLVAGQEGPTLLAGDLNSPPSSLPLRILTAGLQDVFLQSGGFQGLSFPSRFPLWRIDYVLCTPDWNVRSCRLTPPDLSDHRGVLTELAR